jgi:penicillin amidase
MKRLATVLIVLLVVVLIVFGALAVLVRRSFPQVAGQISLPGLHAPVEVLRDAWGVPQIYAEDAHDLFMAQGYVHAQDRFWQMDFWRHIGSGRLSEMFGDSQVETDSFIRTMGWPRLAEQELAAMDPETRAVLENYADGVNAYLDTHSGTQLSFEYALLGVLTPGYKPEPWTPIHSLTWTKAMAWNLGGNMDSEIRRAVLLPQLGPDRVAQLFPPYPSDHPVILPDFRLGSPSSQAQPSSATFADARAPLETVLARLQSLNALTGGGLSGLGSNDWVIGGARTQSGAPILADDMHLGIQMPAIWYENGLHCGTDTASCPYNVIGFSFAGLPGVVVGHNDRIAWGVTNVGPDVQDLYLERVNPANPNQVQFDGAWVDVEARQETIDVAGGDPVTITVRTTRHGPILSDVDEELGALADRASLDEGSPIAVSLRWTALEPSTIIEAALALNRAQSFDDFRKALALWDVPSQNFVYADIDGNIGYQTPGKIPVRKTGDGTLPMPGWTSETDWKGYIPFDDLPYAYNPTAGFVATANNAVVDSRYPYLLTTQFDLGYRAARIVELIEATAKHNAESVAAIHGDDFNAMGPILTPYLVSLDFDKSGESDDQAKKAADLESILATLDGWDGQNKADSSQAALFNAVWRHIILRTFGDDLPAGWLPADDAAFAVVTDLLANPADPFWDDLRTKPLETRDEILRLATQDAVDELTSRLGKDPAKWTWGALHGATFRNESLGESGIAPIEALFNRGPYPTSGGASIVNATGWSYEDGYDVQWLPSERMILDLSDWDAAQAIHTTGESGHTFHPHYIDMEPLWAAIEYAPLPWSRPEVEAQAADRLLLLP